jgi:phosphatidylinositol N-acetylglucosaminyltransferase subunit A
MVNMTTMTTTPTEVKDRSRQTLNDNNDHNAGGGVDEIQSSMKGKNEFDRSSVDDHENTTKGCVGNSSTQQQPRQPKRRYNIAMVCDFFYPRTGGVENHIWSLSQHLIRLGHKVIVVTHAYDNRKGVRYLPGPLKVYYCPFVAMTDQDILPTLTATFPLWRQIMIRERIQIVHTHQATSVMTNESLVYASSLNIPVVYTDHSLFQMDDVAGVVLNRVLETTLSQVSAVICVSHACRDNLILRAKLLRQDEEKEENEVDQQHPIIAVIPNAVDSSKFTPFGDDDDDDDDDNDNDNDNDGDNQVRLRTKESRDEDISNLDDDGRIRIVVVSRLVYRKGVDLLVGIIPKICSRLDNVDFIIGGDGNKLLALQEMVEYHHIQDRVTFLGSVPHVNVANVLRRGSIFLNCSLTESFCIAILEAASCGLLVVSTNVGGVPEVLPEDDMIVLCDPNVDALVDGLTKAIERQQQKQHQSSGILLPPVDPIEAHHRITHMYSWHRVAVQTIHEIYDKIIIQKTDDDDSESRRRRNVTTFRQRLKRYNRLGGFSGIVACILALYIELWIRFIEYTQPVQDIDVVPDLIPPSQSYQQDLS